VVLSGFATVLFVAALLSTGFTSGQSLSALALVVVADLNVVGTVLGESRRRARRAEAGPREPKRRQEEPVDAGQQAIERREATRLLTALEAVAQHQEASIAGRAAVDVVLLAPGRNKIAVIKELRAFLGGGLAESKQLADRAGKEPVLLAAGMPIERARSFADALQRAGARVLLR
jgi:ribosomal protein L7/L12